MKRLATLAALLLLLSAGLIGFGGRASAAPRAAAPKPSQTCVLIIFCFPSSSSPSPSSSPPASSGPLPSGTAAASAPAPTAGPTAAPSASTAAGATPSASGPSPSATAGSKKAVTPKDASAASGLVVPNVTWTMSVGTATMTGFTYKGNVNLPLAGGGTVSVMEFTVRSMTMSNATTVIVENGQTGRETDASFSASGVTMYATRLSGTIVAPGTSLGVLPVTFTPSTASAVLLTITNLVTGTVPITMTNLTADQAVILAGQAQKVTVAVTD